MSAVDAYHATRQREGRSLPDDVVLDLPFSGYSTAQADEWRVRKRSLDRVIRLLGPSPLAVLEIGCGNGWLSARLSEAGHAVTGLDTGAIELAQAERVFATRPVRWVLGDPWTDGLPSGTYDRVLFAASIQYFPDLPALFHRCKALLKKDGEMLIIDSHVYRETAAAERARTRSVVYYASIGTPQMAAFYHHHTEQSVIDAAGNWRVDIMPARRKAAAWLFGRSPFPIVRIRS